MKVSKQAAGIAGSAAVIVALGIGGGAYALTSNDSPAQPQPTRTAVQHVVHPGHAVSNPQPNIPDSDDLPASTPAVSSTPAPSPTKTTPTVGHSTVHAPAPKETPVATTPAPKTSESKTTAPQPPADTGKADAPNPYDGQGNRHGKVCVAMGDIGTVCTVTNNGKTSTYTVPPKMPSASDQR